MSGQQEQPKTTPAEGATLKTPPPIAQSTEQCPEAPRKRKSTEVIQAASNVSKAIAKQIPFEKESEHDHWATMNLQAASSSSAAARCSNKCVSGGPRASLLQLLMCGPNLDNQPRMKEWQNSDAICSLEFIASTAIYVL
ncbi:unnamed protein product [Mesocestoides corti]|uniref:Uncharacterized protein n=1 Tax=Mesocestoides corti TaxID=53468 RepID=A0A0R3UDP5_MESCO|nr:unnamed protein product [Mesocestoides corti]